MESLIVASNAILPIVGIMMLGLYCKNKKIVSEKSFSEFNKIVFKFCLPFTLFENIVNANIGELLNVKLLVYSIGMLIIIAVVTMAILKRTSFPDNQKGTIAQAISRSNFVILGLPIAESIYGANIGVMSVMAAIIGPYQNIQAVFVLQNYSSVKKDIKKTILSVFSNPMVIGALCGVAVSLLHISTPSILMSVIKSFAKMTTPLSLFVLGGSFALESFKQNAALLVKLGIIKLILVPVIGLAGGIALGFRGIELVCLLVLFGGPVAVSSYPMAVEMGMEKDLASQVVFSTTIAVIFSLFIFIFGLNLLGLL